MTASMSATGVVSVPAGNWNNLQVGRGAAGPIQGFGSSRNGPGNTTLPFTVVNSAGADNDRSGRELVGQQHIQRRQQRNQRHDSRCFPVV